jgi:DNA-binding transcriptional LysR family regulator
VNNDLVFFVLLAKHGSLAATARELGLTPPAITKRLMLMEQRLGVRLLNRTTRRVSLTSEGETYLRKPHASWPTFATWRNRYPAAARRRRDCCA